MNTIVPRTELSVWDLNSEISKATHSVRGQMAEERKEFYWILGEVEARFRVERKLQLHRDTFPYLPETM